jgi:hypothetical protein
VLKNECNNSRSEKSGSRSVGPLSVGPLSADLNGEHGNGASIYPLDREAEALSANTCTQDIQERQIVVWGWNRQQSVATKALIVDKTAHILLTTMATGSQAGSVSHLSLEPFSVYIGAVSK